MLSDPFSFKTIVSPAAGDYREKGSRFLAFAFPVRNEEEIRHHLSVLQKKYFDARHHCYAWMLGPEGKHFRAFDAGEPHHSAGDPILGQIRSKGLTDILVVVVRYFGGVKLGVGGLITAYKSAAEDALANSTIVEREVTGTISIIYDYAATPEVMRLVKEYDLKVRSQNFGAECYMTAEYRMKEEGNLLEKIQLLAATGSKISYRS